jgi:hypothetical protein
MDGVGVGVLVGVEVRVGVGVGVVVGVEVGVGVGVGVLVGVEVRVGVGVDVLVGVDVGVGVGVGVVVGVDVGVSVGVGVASASPYRAKTAPASSSLPLSAAGAAIIRSPTPSALMSPATRADPERSPPWPPNTVRPAGVESRSRTSGRSLRPCTR